MKMMIVSLAVLVAGAVGGWLASAAVSTRSEVAEARPEVAKKAVPEARPKAALGELRARIRALEAELAKPRRERKPYAHELHYGDYMTEVSFKNARGEDMKAGKLSLDKIPDMETLKETNPALYDNMVKAAKSSASARHQALKQRVRFLQDADTSALSDGDKETLASYCRLLVDDSVLEDMMSATYPHTKEQRAAANEERKRVWKERDEVGRDVRDMLTLSVLKSAGVPDETAVETLKAAVILYEATARVAN